MSSSHVPVTTNQILWFSHGFPMVFLWFSHGFPTVPVTTNQLCMADPIPTKTDPKGPSPWIPVSCKAGHCCTRSCAVAWIFDGKRQLYTTLDLGFSSKFAKQKKNPGITGINLGKNKLLWLSKLYRYAYMIIYYHHSSLTNPIDFGQSHVVRQSHSWGWPKPWRTRLLTSQSN